MKPVTILQFLAAFAPFHDPRRPDVLGTARDRRLVLVWRGKGRRSTKLPQPNGV